MKERTKIIWVFSIYSVMLILLSLLIFALFPYLPENLRISEQHLELVLYESVNIITNLYLTLFYVRHMIKRKNCNRVLMWILSIAVSALFALFIASMLKERPEKKEKSRGIFN